MVANIKCYLVLLHIFIKDIYAYRFDAFSKLFGYPIQFGLTLILWYSLSKGGADIDLQYMASYYALSFVLVNQYPFVRMAMSLQMTIANGNYVRNMISGISIITESLAEFWVKALWFNALSIPCAIALASITTGIEVNVVKVFGLITLILIGGTIQCLLWVCISMSAFWIIMNSGVAAMFQNIQRLATGAIIPLSLLPIGLANLLEKTPFPYSLYYPVQYYLDSSISFFEVAIPQLFWLCILFSVSHAIYLAGTNISEGSMI